MATRRSALAAMTAAVGLLLTMTPGGATAGGPPEAARQRDGAAAVIASYQAKIPELMAEEHVPGLAVALVDGDHVVWQQGFGSTDSDGGKAVTVDTIFSVQSMSKVFTATAVMQAVQAGRLDLDVPITTYLPDFTVHSAFEAHPERRITLRMLLGCTAGFTHEAPLGNNYEPEPGDFGAHVRSISETWLRFPVGTGVAYSNLGFDLAARILEQVSNKPFPHVMHDSLLAPLGMDHSTFDRARVHASDNRAVGHEGIVAPRVESPMTAAGGLWASAADLARFLEFQLGDGTIDGHAVLDAALIEEMRTVPAPRAGAPAGYALGVSRSRWRAGYYLDIFFHGGGGDGFLTAMYWVPPLHIGVVVLTNSSDDQDLEDTVALGLLQDLVTAPGSVYHDRFLALPAQVDVAEPDVHFSPPPDLAASIEAVAMPASRQQSTRWAAYPEFYRTGRRGAMNPGNPASRFHVESGVPYFDAGEDGTLVRHRLSEFRPGLFLAENGETLDLRTGSQHWRGMSLHPVTNGPLGRQWALLAVVVAVAVGWLIAGSAASLRRHRRGADRSTTVSAPPGDRIGRRLTTAVAAVGALAALVTVAAIRVLPGLVDVGFLGWMAMPLPARLALHLPLAVALLASVLAALLVAGALRRWWTPRIRSRDAALLVALTTLTIQLASWHTVAWGF
jgi:CubicO group peptidase (beta-lactamase class C family)